MAFKMILGLCTQAVFIQIALSQQCTSHVVIDVSGLSSPYTMSGFSAPATMAYDRSGPGITYNGWPGRGLSDIPYSSAKEFIISNDGGLPVTSISSISPRGIFVKSDNFYEGPVIVSGELPFISAVVVEGNLDTNGGGVIMYGCGNGVVAMLSEEPASTSSGALRRGLLSPGPNVPFSSSGGFHSGLALGLDNGFSPFTSSGRAVDYANARIGAGGCGCDMIY